MIINQPMALARKWRPTTFADVVSQSHVVQALSNALSQNRLHHAYLFTGGSGIGKTTIARIFAKAINCEVSISPTPCEQCSTCKAMNAGNFVDLIEVDAASRTRVEDTRDLLDNVPYAPSKGRFKIYLIDEVHMLSTHSFNALLKTLEEPPEHVKFLLATTDPQKLPITVLTRCLQFHLKRMPTEHIAERLASILTQENIDHESPALHTLAHAAQGSMRDALSLLDQAIAHGNGKINAADVATLMGTSKAADLFALLTALSAHDADQLLLHLQTINEGLPDFDQLLNELSTVLHQVSLCQMLPNAPLENIWQANEPIVELSQILRPETVQLYYQIALIGRRDLMLAPTPQIGFEMILMRMLAFRPADIPPEAVFTPAQKTMPKKTPHQTIPAASVRQTETTLKPEPETEASIQPQTTTTSPPNNAAQWRAIVTQLQITGITKVIAQHCAFIQLTDATLELQLDPQYAPMLNPEHEKRLSQAISTHCDQPIGIRIALTTSTSDNPSLATEKAQQAAEKKAHTEKQLHADRHAQDIIEGFNATLIEVQS